MNINFADYYKGLSNTELFDILDNANSYQPAALVAARNEIDLRNLSPAEIESAKFPLVAKKLFKDERIEKVKKTKEKMRTAGDSIFNYVKASDTKEDIINKIIFFIVIIYALYFFIAITSFITGLRYATGGFLFWIVLFLLLLPQLLLPPALINFWKRKSLGWTLMTLCVSFMTVIDLEIIYQNYKWMSDPFFGTHKLPVNIMDIFRLFIHFSTLYVLCTGNIRVIYKVEISKLTAVLFIGIILGIFSLILQVSLLK